jgi:hypothetical protein
MPFILARLFLDHMAAGDSQVSICNIGLLALGVDLISDINAPQRRAIVCLNSWDRVRREVLEAAPWRFALKQAQLPANVNTPPFGYEAAFDLPGDFISMYMDDEDQDTSWKWEIVGNQLFSNSGAPVNVYYVRDVSDPKLFPPLFCRVLGLEIAVQNALALTQDTKKRDEAKVALSEAWAIARTRSAQQALPSEWGGDILLRARW